MGELKGKSGKRVGVKRVCVEVRENDEINICCGNCIFRDTCDAFSGDKLRSKWMTLCNEYQVDVDVIQGIMEMTVRNNMLDEFADGLYKSIISKAREVLGDAEMSKLIETLQNEG